MLGLADLLLQGRERRLVGGDQTSQTQHARIGGRAGAHLRFGGLAVAALELDELLGGANLGRVGRARDRWYSPRWRSG